MQELEDHHVKGLRFLQAAEQAKIKELEAQVPAWETNPDGSPVLDEQGKLVLVPQEKRNAIREQLGLPPEGPGPRMPSGPSQQALTGEGN